MAYRNEQDQDPHQLELMTGLLEGAEPDAYVVIPVGALVTQLTIALEETKAKDGRYRAGRASVRLVRNLHTLGWCIDTKHSPAEPS